MSNYTIHDLRGDLAETIKALKTGDKDMTIEKAKAIGELAQTIINSAKVEVDALRVAGGRRMQPTGFLALEHQDTLAQQERTEGRHALDGPRPKPHIRQAVGSSPRGAL